MLTELFSVIAPVLICAVIGFSWARLGRPYDTELVTTLVTNIGVPCLVFSTFTSVKVDPRAFGLLAVATIIILAINAIVAVAILKVTRQPLRAFLPALIFPNSGNMGLPLALLAFGDAGLALAVVVFTVYAIAQMTAGVAIAAGSFAPRTLVRQPIIYGLVAALAFLAAGVAAPAWLANTTRILGGMAVPLMLITLGISLAKLHVRSLGLSLALAVGRLAVGFGLGLGVATLLGLSGMERGVMIVQATMPVAVFNYLFAERYATRPAEVAGAVVVSTVISFASLPLLLWFVL
jgi:predicted permease